MKQGSHAYRRSATEISEMNFKGLLKEKQNIILQRWHNAVVETYPADTSDFLKKRQNRFANPVGFTITEVTEGLFEELLSESGTAAKTAELIDRIVRIRAVQEFSPSQAISFFFSLKHIIRSIVNESDPDKPMLYELAAFESKVDDIVLAAFDIFMSCREKIYEIRANEARNLTFRLLQRANLLCEKDSEEPAPPGEIPVNFKTKEVAK